MAPSLLFTAWARVILFLSTLLPLNALALPAYGPTSFTSLLAAARAASCSVCGTRWLGLTVRWPSAVGRTGVAVCCGVYWYSAACCSAACDCASRASLVWMREVLGPSGNAASWPVSAASLTSFAWRRSEYLGGAQQPEASDLVASNSDADGEDDVEAAEEEDAEEEEEASEAELETMNRSSTLPYALMCLREQRESVDPNAILANVCVDDDDENVVV